MVDTKNRRIYTMNFAIIEKQREFGKCFSVMIYLTDPKNTVQSFIGWDIDSVRKRTWSTMLEGDTVTEYTEQEWIEKTK